MLITIRTEDKKELISLARDLGIEDEAGSPAWEFLRVILEDRMISKERDKLERKYKESLRRIEERRTGKV